MSYTIEYNKKIYHYTDENNIKKYVWLCKYGDNNVYDSDTNLRARSWNLIIAGTIQELWKEIGKSAGSVAGGCLQKAVGWSDTRWYTIEEYIKQYRSKVKNSKPIEGLLYDFSVDVSIYLKEKYEAELLTEEVKNKIDKLKTFIKKYEMKSGSYHYYHKNLREHYMHIKEVKQLIDLIDNLQQEYGNEYRVVYSFSENKFKGVRMYG